MHVFRFLRSKKTSFKEPGWDILKGELHHTSDKKSSSWWIEALQAVQDAQCLSKRDTAKNNATNQRTLHLYDTIINCIGRAASYI